MRLPNGMGGIYEMKDRKRRNPWRVRVTVGWDEVTKKQLFHTVGYFKSRSEALKALMAYHENPYDLKSDITFAEVYQRWSDEKFGYISSSNVKAYRASFKCCESLYGMKFVEIRATHLQAVVDKCGKNYPTLRKLKVLFNQMYHYAIGNHICEMDYSDYVDIVKHKERKAELHKPFTDAEIAALWDNEDRNEYVSVVLMLIYSGVRIGELLDLKKENVHLVERYFDVIESKTDAGIRKVPIADKTMPFFEKWMQNKSDRLICNSSGKKFTYSVFKENYWKQLMEELQFDHLPHDTRHTTVSMLAKAEVNQTLIKRIVGHSGAMSLTERVYTHTDIQQLIDAINKI
jgi:integrase